MATRDIAAAIQRVESVLQRRPGHGLREDSPATARWDGGTRMLTRHANGTEVLTDMPAELGGGGEAFTPGWLLRAGLASCTATCIVMDAAVAGIELKTLELVATSRSDTRGALGMTDHTGAPVHAEARDVELLVRISAHDVQPERLRSLIEASDRRAPVCCTLRESVPVTLRIEIETA